MAEHLVKIPCHIVFILKLYCKFLLSLFRCPAYLQLAPLPEELCSSGNAADYQRLIGIMGLSPLRGSLRAAPKNRDGSIIIPNFSIMAISRTTRLFSLSVDRSLRIRYKHLGRSWRQKTSRFEKRGKIRSTELFSFQGTIEVGLLPSSQYNGHFLAVCQVPRIKFFEFFLHRLIDVRDCLITDALFS